jgi:hypothetical protein
MATLGRIAGMTMILAGALPPYGPDNLWRIVFMAGSIAAPAFLGLIGVSTGFAVPVSNLALVVGGVIVGIGVTYGNGCTSGHGVCGIARLSPRSIVATITFMAAGFVTVYVVRHVIGGI